MFLTPQSVDLPGRVRLSYVEQGDASGAPILLLHGVTDSWRSFEPVLPHLPNSLHVFVLTQRGHGDSEHPETGYRTRDFSGDLAAFVDALGLRAVVVVGHSMGSINGTRFAIDHPARVSGLVLVGGFAGVRHNQVVREFWETTIADLKDPVDPELAREFQVSTLAQPVPNAYLEMVIKESLKVPARVWRSAFAGFLEDDFVDGRDSIKAPTLLMWGDRDAFCSRSDQDALLKAIPASRLVVYEGAGHALHWEEPERFASDLITFVESLS